MPAPVHLKQGDKFGRLTVVRLLRQRGPRGERLWQCRCSCTRRTLVALPCAAFRRRDGTKSCGCLARERCTLKRGQRFGRLTVRRLTDLRKDGRRVWECKCKCGNRDPVLVTGKALRGEHVKSCGCLKLEGNSSHFPSPAEQRRRYKAGCTQHDEKGRPFLSLSAAAKFCGVTVQTVLKWVIGCGWLDGAGIETKEFKDGLGRWVPYYLKEDLEDIRLAKATRANAPDVPGYTYVGDLVDDLGVTLRTVNKKLQRIRVTKKKVHGRSKDNCARLRAYVPNRVRDKLLAGTLPAEDGLLPRTKHGPDRPMAPEPPHDVNLVSISGIPAIHFFEERLDAKGMSKTVERLCFDDYTHTVTLDGKSYPVADPKAYLILKVIAGASPDTIPKPEIRCLVRGVNGVKTIPEKLNILPKALQKIVVATNTGYCIRLSSKIPPTAPRVRP